MLKIIKTVRAEQDLIDIWSYSFNKWGEAQADRYLDRLNAGFSLVAKNPQMCRQRKECEQPAYIHLCEHHLIVYAFNSKTVTIVRVLHESMNIEIQLDY
ncbi:MAG: type II toxin-antitoxin system RelE/ParE family toxin [Candidatus Thiodiazotropha sp. L084R]